MTLTPMTAPEARAAVADLLARLDPKNSSPALHAHLRNIIEAFDTGDEERALELVDFGAGHVADTVNLARIRREYPETLVDGEPPLQADESTTGVYFTLSDIRHRLGYLGRGKLPSNVNIIRQQGAR